MDRPTATLRLRGSAGPVEARLHYPTRVRSQQLVIAFVDGATADNLCSELGAIVIEMRSTPHVHLQPLLEWIVTHASELGASADYVAVTGVGDGAATAQDLVASAALEGWPPLQLLATPVKEIRKGQQR